MTHITISICVRECLVSSRLGAVCLIFFRCAICVENFFFSTNSFSQRNGLVGFFFCFYILIFNKRKRMNQTEINTHTLTDSAREMCIVFSFARKCTGLLHAWRISYAKSTLYGTTVHWEASLHLHLRRCWSWGNDKHRNGSRLHHRLSVSNSAEPLDVAPFEYFILDTPLPTEWCFCAELIKLENHQIM